MIEEGFRKFTEQVQQAKELTFSSLVKYKIDIQYGRSK